MADIKEVLKDEKSVTAYGKLKKDRTEVDINPSKFLLAFTTEELQKLEAQPLEGLSEEEIKSLEQTKQSLKENIERYSTDRLQGFMVPLKYRDLQIIKSGIFEAVQAAKQYNWDDDVKIRAMLREERTLTVYLSLKKKDDISKPYYESLEMVSAVTDTAIDDLYDIYITNFVLSEAERKNS